ncbi:hypothetical protein [Anaeromicrobium sediminis]|nr:hypothetical protein [Anaeromicrobium sediminis]
MKKSADIQNINFGWNMTKEKLEKMSREEFLGFLKEHIKYWLEEYK